MAKKRRKGREINGILLLDKPAGLTSNAALQIVKRLFVASKAGHTGSLDPLATGLLPICLGEATKLSGFLLEADKQYLATCKLGVRTRTGDAEGEIIASHEIPPLTEEIVRAVLDEFTGQISQIPPMHSAIKVDGQPLYKLAHQGKEIERKPRTVQVYEIRLLRLEGDELDIEVHCSKGTYIRTLAEDIGERLGCGAHLAALRRTGSTPFSLEQTVSLPEIEHLAEEGTDALDELLLPMETALEDWTKVILSSQSAYYLCQGQAVMVPKAPSEGMVTLFSDGGGFLGVGEVLDDGRVAPRRLMVNHAN